MNKISIIIPVYNVQPYLERCIKSILKQTYSNWECLIIDDGSTDQSGQLCDIFASKDNRVTVFHKENEGLGLTRNYGIERATGDYICFVDSDDFLEEEALDYLVSTMAKEVCDLVIGNFYYLDKAVNLPLTKGRYEGKSVEYEIISRMIGGQPGRNDYLTTSACGKLYKREIIEEHNLRFLSERKLIWEDLVFNMDYLSECNSVYLSDKPIYRYCYNAVSLTHRYDKHKISKVIEMYEYMGKRILRFKAKEELSDRLNFNFLGHIRTCLKLEAFYSRKNGRSTAINNIKAICVMPDVKKIVNSVALSRCTGTQKILSICMIKDWYLIVYCLCKLQNMKKNIV